MQIKLIVEVGFSTANNKAAKLFPVIHRKVFLIIKKIQNNGGLKNTYTSIAEICTVIKKIRQ
jgi:hypothetical protein